MKHGASLAAVSTVLSGVSAACFILAGFAVHRVLGLVVLGTLAALVAHGLGKAAAEAGE
jgi:multisubunit Na+/H+ antiporter MnhG subunit